MLMAISALTTARLGAVGAEVDLRRVAGGGIMLALLLGGALLWRLPTLRRWMHGAEESAAAHPEAGIGYRGAWAREDARAGGG
ncbi:hypothetical protein [Chondromyces crocatus]|uniref:Uncharacterized protein n=1 Tax=Chondromyces crocatus TaxID=52 RepID=A0A0K1EB96_CHOCO|nr:hypothetical protein [Chondromyces crocatus]AKT37853.1 uncharacterized protein CMC5_019960 [Chondromyces crocatus]